MKRVITTIVSFLIFVCTFAQSGTESAEKVECKYIIDGHFFMEMSKDLKDISIIPLRTSDKKMVMGVVFVNKDSKIPVEFLASEVPFERVKNAQEILELYESKVIWTNLITEKAKEGRTLQEGMILDEFSLKDFDETIWDNKRIAGKVTVINVWYSGCGPCLSEMPIISKWKEDFPDVNFLSVDYENKEKMQRIAEKRGFTWTHLYNDRYFTSWVTTQTSDSGYPLTIVVDKDGIIRHVVHGTSEEKREAVVDAINKLLK